MDSILTHIEDVLRTYCESDEEIASARIKVHDQGAVKAEMHFLSEISSDEQDRLSAASNSRNETVIITDSQVFETVHEVVANFEAKWVVETEVEQEIVVEPSELVYRGDKWSVQSEFTISSEDSSWVQEFAEEVLEVTSMIETAEDFRFMSVRISVGDDLMPYDYTIYFATDEPHEYWANCDTLEEYCEMVAEQNDDTTVQEMLKQDEYQSHTHLMNKQEPVNDWFDQFVNSVITASFETADDIRVYPNHFRTEFDGYSIDGTLIQPV